MCGIAGILSTQENQQVVADKLATMQQHLAHRGPDGRGDYVSPSGHAALAHTRLSIIDLSTTGAQPMSTTDGRYTISFNGEIYNYRDLKAELITQGHRFHSDSDTEVILALYAQFGAKLVHKLRGMFAFIIWDEVEKVGFAARDPLGIKPLYFWHDEKSFAVASELRALIAAGFSDYQANANGVYSYLKTGTVSEPNTLYKDLALLPAGHALSWVEGKVNLKQYWSLNFQAKDMSLSEAQQLTRAALESSIRAHFVADVPVGVFLSGGIDSTAIVALASKLLSQPINTYSIAFADPEWNEADVARRVADHFGTKHTEFLVTPEIAKPLFDEFLKAIDQPTIDGFNTFCVSKLASEAGEKVVLSGLGGDELFAGYKSFELLPKMTRISSLLRPLVIITRWKSKLLNRFLPAKLRRVFDFLVCPGSLRAAHTSLRGVFSDSEARAITKQWSNASITSAAPEALQPTQADSISALELSSYMRNQLLRDSDVASMAWGLELRVPFVDKHLLEQLSLIPAEHRLRYGKKLLIEAVPEIPDWVVNRPKQGFRFPFDEWFAESWNDMKLAKAPPPWIKLQPWYRRWSLLVLEDWFTRYAK